MGLGRRRRLPETLAPRAPPLYRVGNMAFNRLGEGPGWLPMQTPNARSVARDGWSTLLNQLTLVPRAHIGSPYTRSDLAAHPPTPYTSAPSQLR
eukprot:6213912-Pleurochrysis_carterae.AAC.3